MTERSYDNNNKLNSLHVIVIRHNTKRESLRNKKSWTRKRRKQKRARKSEGVFIKHLPKNNKIITVKCQNLITKFYTFIVKLTPFKHCTCTYSLHVVTYMYMYL